MQDPASSLQAAKNSSERELTKGQKIYKTEIISSPCEHPRGNVADLHTSCIRSP